MCAYALGSIGGLGYALYCKAYVIAVAVVVLAVAVVVLAVMAFPTLKKFYNNLINQ